VEIIDPPASVRDEAATERRVRAMLPEELRAAPVWMIEDYAAKELAMAVHSLENTRRRLKLTIYQVDRDREEADEYMGQARKPDYSS